MNRNTTTRRTFAAILAGLLPACGSTNAATPRTDAGAEDGAAAATPIVPEHPKCSALLECASRNAPAAFPDLLSAYGPDGTCWKGDAANLIATCERACEGALAQCTPSAGSDAGDDAGHGDGASPDEASYPTKGLGTRARGMSNGQPASKPGDVIRNFAFRGYPKGDTSKGLQAVSLADFYDPQGKRFKLLHIAVVAAWSPPSAAETEAIVAQGDAYAQKGVAWLEALVEGPTQGQPADESALATWTKTYKLSFTDVLDPGAQSLGVFFDAAAVPGNIDVDPRSMEILEAGVGAIEPRDVDPWLTWVTSHPATTY